MTKMQTPLRNGSRPSRQRWFAAGLLLSAACGDDSSHATADASAQETAGMDAGTNSTGDAGGNVNVDVVGNVSLSDGGNSPPAHEGGHAMTGDGGVASHHPCGQPYARDPRDETMTGELVRVVTSDNGTPSDTSDDLYDLLLPREMLDWLKEQNWIQEHGDWHNIRRWEMGCPGMQSGAACPGAEAMIARGLTRAPIQEGEPGDGYDFLIMHRHMIRGFEQAFPNHVEQVRAFYRLPRGKSDAENPIPWVDVQWSDDQLQTIEWLENITQHSDAFTSEDDYAKWVQFGENFPGFNIAGGLPDGGFFPPDGGFPAFPGGGFPGAGFPGKGRSDGGLPGAPVTGAPVGSTTADGGVSNRPGGGIHGALHGQWSVQGSPYSLVDNNKNVQNFAFWRLHGWIDEMWERYRRARGLGEDDNDYQQALIDQCEEMHKLGEALPPQSPDAGIAGSDGGTSASTETGAFATQVAPILNSHCAGSVCHGADSPTLGLALAAAAPSVIRAGLVGKRASEAPLALVDPGKPEQSWLYLKLTGNFAAVDCTTSRCTTMPPAGTKPSTQDVERIRAWIAAGAGPD